MGESSACVVRSFSQPSHTSDEFKEEDPLRALTSSISFGRFVSDSLAWEKWSSFTQNRYLEEVKKYSKPGSVAEKKAYFEAHYKRKAAKKDEALLKQENAFSNDAALLEQENMAANDLSSESNDINEIYNTSSIYPEIVLPEKHVSTDEMKGEAAPNAQLVLSDDTVRCDVEENKFEIGQVEDAESVTKQLKMIELSNQLEIVENHRKIVFVQEKSIPVMDATNQRDLASLRKAKPAISSSLKSSTYNGASKFLPPARPTSFVHPRKAEIGTPNNRKMARDSTDKNRSTPKSLHLSINFASRASETSKISPILDKIGNSRIVKAFVKTSKDRSTQQTPTRASVNVVSKGTSVTPQPESRRSRTVLNQSVNGILDGKSRIPSMNHSESSTACGRKARPPTVTSSFSFKSEERVAKRKEKLEEKPKAKDGEKHQLQEKSKIPPTRPCLPKLGRRPTPNIIHNSSSRPPWRSSGKVDSSKHVTEKHSRMPTRSNKSRLRNSMCENDSPNIHL